MRERPATVKDFKENLLRHTYYKYHNARKYSDLDDDAQMFGPQYVHFHLEFISPIICPPPS